MKFAEARGVRRRSPAEPARAVLGVLTVAGVQASLTRAGSAIEYALTRIVLSSEPAILNDDISDHSQRSRATNDPPFDQPPHADGA
jgi:hypothetical protein